MLTAAEFLASTITVMTVMTVGLLGQVMVQMSTCGFVRSRIPPSRMPQQKQTQSNCRLAMLCSSHKLILQTTEYTKQCLPHKGINMAREQCGDGWV